AELIAQEHGASIVSADTYPGLYARRVDDLGGPLVFRAALLGKAHGMCFKDAIHRVGLRYSVVVDNTNLTTQEIAPYILLAQAYNATPKIIRMECDPERAFARQTHGVPRRIERDGKLVAGFDAMVERLAAFKPVHHWQSLPGFTIETVKSL